jgi:hypothetical protein
LTLAPVIDTSIYSSGGNPQGTGSILSGTRNNGIVDRGLLRFTLPTIPAGAVITSTRLRLQVVKVPRSPANSDFGLHRMKKSWAGDATWINASGGSAWAAPGGMSDVDYVATASATRFVTGGGIYDFNTPQLVADIGMWRAIPGTNFGWLLRTASEATGGTARHFGANESAQPPQLQIDYQTPAPVPRLANVRLEGTNITFDFTGSPGWIYRVECRDNVDYGAWSTIANLPAGGTTNTISVIAPLATVRRFYRVIAE